MGNIHTCQTSIWHGSGFMHCFPMRDFLVGISMTFKDMNPAIAKGKIINSQPHSIFLCFSWNTEPKLGHLCVLSSFNYISRVAEILQSSCFSVWHKLPMSLVKPSFLQAHTQCATRNSIFLSNKCLWFAFFVQFSMSLQFWVNR